MVDDDDDDLPRLPLTRCPDDRTRHPPHPPPLNWRDPTRSCPDYPRQYHRTGTKMEGYSSDNLFQ